MCIFCKIINKEINAKIVYENETTLAFQDIKPKADVHILVIPKKHIDNLNEINKENIHLLEELMESIIYIVKKEEIKNYRVITNCGEKAGQEVMHLHFHILGYKD